MVGCATTAVCIPMNVCVCIDGFSVYVYRRFSQINHADSKLEHFVPYCLLVGQIMHFRLAITDIRFHTETHTHIKIYTYR